MRSKTSLESKDMERFGLWDDSNITDFDPERWLFKNKQGEVEFDPHAGPMHGFGAGPRSCFGESLSKTIQLLLLFDSVVFPKFD